MLLRRKRVFQHAALQKLEACPYPSGAGKFTLKSANFSILLNRCHLGCYKPRIRRLSLIGRANPVLCLPRPSPASAGRRRTFSLFTISRLCCTLKFVSPFPTRRVFTLRQRERLSAFTLPSNFRSPVSGLPSPVSKFSTSYFVISTSQRERVRAVTLRQRERLSAFTLPKLRERFAFTLLEILVVIGIIAIMMGLIAPAVTSLSKSNGRKAAIANLLGGIEQARAEAIKSGQATYVVFPTFASGAQSTLDRYNYKSYAIFEDDAANPGSVKQLTEWKSFPIGVALRAAGTAALSNLADPATLTPSVAFSFAPDPSAAPLKCFKFNSNGEVQAPAGNVLLGIFEGYVNGSEVATTKDGSGNPSAVEYLMVSQFTGRAEPTATP